MNGYFCPVEGCDFGRHKEKEQTQVTRHIRAKSGEEHADVDRLQKLVAEQGEDDDEGNEDSGGGDPDDDLGDEGADNTESDPEEESDMPTDEEYQQQYDDQQDGEDQDDESTDSGGGSASLLPALDQRTVMMLVGLAVVLVVAYTFLNRNGNDSDPVDIEETDDTDDSGGEVTLIE